jgi:hypothetical protein
LLGAALLTEAVAAIRAISERRRARRKPLTMEFPDALAAKREELGTLKAVFQSADSRTAVVALVLGVAGELALLHWLKEGADKPKVLAAALLGPSLVVYLLCRVMRLPLRRQSVFVFSGGLVHIVGSHINTYLWEGIDEVRYELDSVDDHILEIRFKFGFPPLRLGRFQFPNLKQLELRLQQEIPPNTAEHSGV